MSPQEVTEFLNECGERIDGLCKIQDSAGVLFLVINHGISDDGEGLNITVIAKIG